MGFEGVGGFAKRYKRADKQTFGCLFALISMYYCYCSVAFVPNYGYFRFFYVIQINFSY